MDKQSGRPEAHVAGTKRRDRSAERNLDHGSVTCYMYSKCNCVDCRAAWAQRTQDLKQQRKQQLADGTADVAHGKVTTYINWGCRCVECTSAWCSRASRRRAAKRVAAAEQSGGSEVAAGPVLVGH